jgi:hypothetical protein
MATIITTPHGHPSAPPHGDVFQNRRPTDAIVCEGLVTPPAADVRPISRLWRSSAFHPSAGAIPKSASSGRRQPQPRSLSPALPLREGRNHADGGSLSPALPLREGRNHADGGSRQGQPREGLRCVKPHGKRLQPRPWG